MNSKQIKGPIIIGGVGGSGTRVVAEILSKFGFYIGNDLNEASDNLLFTFLFKRPKWFYQNRNNQRQIETGIRLLHEHMVGKRCISLPKLIFLSRAFVSMSLFGHNDMAFSKNQQQLYNWGPLFRVPRPMTSAEEPGASLKYWIWANEKVLNIGKEIGEKRFLLVNFDELCLSPQEEVSKLLAFLDIEVDREVFEDAACLPKTPSSIGRYKLEDIRQFSEKDMNLLPRFGFSLER